MLSSSHVLENGNTVGRCELGECRVLALSVIPYLACILYSLTMAVANVSGVKKEIQSERGFAKGHTHKSALPIHPYSFNFLGDRGSLGHITTIRLLQSLADPIDDVMEATRLFPVSIVDADEGMSHHLPLMLHFDHQGARRVHSR